MGKMGDGFARIAIAELASGVDVFKCAGNDGGRYGYADGDQKNRSYFA